LALHVKVNNGQLTAQTKLKRQRGKSPELSPGVWLAQSPNSESETGAFWRRGPEIEHQIMFVSNLHNSQQRKPQRQFLDVFNPFRKGISASRTSSDGDSCRIQPGSQQLRNYFLPELLWDVGFNKIADILTWRRQSTTGGGVYKNKRIS